MLKTNKSERPSNPQNVRNGRKGGAITSVHVAVGKWYLRQRGIDPRKGIPADLRKKLAA